MRRRRNFWDELFPAACRRKSEIAFRAELHKKHSKSLKFGKHLFATLVGRNLDFPM